MNGLDSSQNSVQEFDHERAEQSRAEERRAEMPTSCGQSQRRRAWRLASFSDLTCTSRLLPWVGSAMSHDRSQGVVEQRLDMMVGERRNGWAHTCAPARTVSVGAAALGGAQSVTWVHRMAVQRAVRGCWPRQDLAPHLGRLYRAESTSYT